MDPYASIGFANGGGGGGGLRPLQPPPQNFKAVQASFNSIFSNPSCETLKPLNPKP